MIQDNIFENVGRKPNTVIIPMGPASAWDIVMQNVPNPRVIPYQLARRFYDSSTIQEAIRDIERHWYNNRTVLIQIFESINQNGTVSSLIRDAVNSVLNKGIIIGKSETKINSVATKRICKKKWFKDLCADILRAQYWGYSAQYLGEWDGSKMVGGKTIRRELIDPDRRIILQQPSLPNGATFDDELMAYCYALITTTHDEGRMPCGYGVFFKIMMEYLYFKTARSGNAIFLGKFGSPNIHIKSDAADSKYIADPDSTGNKQRINPEWVQLEKSAQEFSAGGTFLTGKNVDVEVLESSIGKNDPFSKFIDLNIDVIKSMILGHENAQSTTPGQLGTAQGGTNSAEYISKEGVIANACDFLCENLNSIILDKLVRNGVRIEAGDMFFIPNNTKKNNDDLMLIDKASKTFTMVQQAKIAGVKIPIKWVAELTGIPIEEDNSFEEQENENNFQKKDVKSLIDAYL